jgi:hypothetical protein
VCHVVLFRSFLVKGQLPTGLLARISKPRSTG